MISAVLQQELCPGWPIAGDQEQTHRYFDYMALDLNAAIVQHSLQACHLTGRAVRIDAVSQDQGWADDDNMDYHRSPTFGRLSIWRKTGKPGPARKVYQNESGNHRPCEYDHHVTIFGHQHPMVAALLPSDRLVLEMEEHTAAWVNTVRAARISVLFSKHA